jgi:hypothetical protein
VHLVGWQDNDHTPHRRQNEIDGILFTLGVFAGVAPPICREPGERCPGRRGHLPLPWHPPLVPAAARRFPGRLRELLDCRAARALQLQQLLFHSLGLLVGVVLAISILKL